MTVTFGGTLTGTGLAADMQKGIIDCFRSLPISRSAVVVGRTASDVIYNALSLIIMALAGLLVGLQIHNGVFSAVLWFRSATAVRLRHVVDHALRQSARE